MLNFNQFFNLINGEPYELIPAPTSYNFGDYVASFSSVNNTEDGSWALRPLKDEDMGRYAADDVVDHMQKIKANGFNSTCLGPPMTDDEFQRYAGQG